MVAFGGSQTEGKFCGEPHWNGTDFEHNHCWARCADGHESSCAWPQRVADWLEHVIPRASVKHVNHARGSTTSAFSLQILLETYQKNSSRPLDLVLVDHSANDLALLDVQEGRGLKIATESLVRSVLGLPQRPALLMFTGIM